ncbi:MAG TPA: hypothetical protein VEJ87_07655 [Acidimicrobiales bacterium]|nr:hypothetical protein [Acidimicrobiales bacterium]
MASDGRWYPPELHPAVRQAGQASAYSVAHGYAGVQAPAVTSPRSIPSGFDSNPFAVSSLLGGPTPTKKKGHLSLPLVVTFIVIVVGIAGAVGYFLTHPSPQRSPDSVALDFYEHLGQQPADYTGALSDVLPQERAQAAGMGSLHEVQVVVQQIGTQNLSVYNPGPPSGTTKTVQIKACNADLSCGPLSVSVPTAEYESKWYVDFNAWDAIAQHEDQDQ